MLEFAFGKLYSYNFPPSSNADLRELTLSDIELAPAFAGGTTSYTASVDNSVASTTVTAAPVQRFAEVVISPADTDGNTEGHQVSLE